MKTPGDELQQLRAENQELRQTVEKLHNEMIRLISHNLDLADQLEDYTGLRRRARAEYLQQPSKVQAVRRQDSTTGRTYSLSGAQATETTRGIVIRDGHKMVR